MSGDGQTYELLVFDSQGPTTLIDPGSASPVIAHAFTGTVTQQGDGFPSDVAPSDVLRRLQHLEEYRFLRVTNGNRTWTIALRNAVSFGVRDGAQVEVEASYEWAGSHRCTAV